MREGLLRLLELQDIDKELQALKDAREAYPAEISSRQREIDRAAKVLESYAAALAETGTRQRQLQRELEAAKNSLKEHEARFSQVTNNREYDALQLEIEACRTRIGEYETQILEVIDKSEVLQQQSADETARCEDIRDSQQARIDELQTQLDTLQQQVDAVAARRLAFAGSVPDQLLRLYERMRKKAGTRVAAVRKGACGGCFRELPAQHRSNVRRNEEPFFCESCGALLVWDEEST